VAPIAFVGIINANAMVQTFSLPAPISQWPQGVNFMCAFSLISQILMIGICIIIIIILALYASPFVSFFMQINIPCLFLCRVDELAFSFLSGLSIMHPPSPCQVSVLMKLDIQ